MRFFDPNDELTILRRGNLPHWSQDGTVVFITCRTADSLPRHLVEQWITERNTWLRTHGISTGEPAWKRQLRALPPELLAEFHDQFTHRWHDHLDDCHGKYLLRRSDCSSALETALHHFDGDRYRLHSFVIMPNHVQILATFPNRADMLRQCRSWKQFTAAKIHHLTGGSGRFWRQDSFDHLVRHEAQFRRLVRYLNENPVKARLPDGEFRLFVEPELEMSLDHPRLEPQKPMDPRKS